MHMSTSSNFPNSFDKDTNIKERQFHYHTRRDDGNRDVSASYSEEGANSNVKENLNSLTIGFHNVLNCHQISSAIITTLEYLLYHRFQIPEPADLLRRSILCGRQPNNDVVTGFKAHMSRSDKKRDAAILFMDNISKGIQEFFCDYQVTKVVVLLGSTIVSPKETFVLSVKPISTNKREVPSAQESTKLRNLRMRVGRELITNPALQGINCPLMSTNSFVLICAANPKDCSVPHYFTPKHRLSLSSRGERFDIVFKQPDHCFEHFNQTEWANDQARRVGDGFHQCYNDYVWYQSKFPLKGYKLQSK